MRCSVLLAALISALTAVTAAGESMTAVPMYDKGFSTYYVAGRIDGYGATEFLVDTGSAYVILTEDMLKVLKARGHARYLRELTGVMADGSQITVPVFLIRGIHVGGDCEIRDVEATVVPHASRLVLGLSALRKAAPFSVSLEPPSLSLSGCGALQAQSDQS